MENIKYSFQMNMWGVPQFKQINNLGEWYDEDFTAHGYMQDWDNILKYLSTAGYKGIELVWYQVDFLRMQFGSLAAFAEFVKKRGIEKVTGGFSIHFNSERKDALPGIIAAQQKNIDNLAELGAEAMIVMPAGQYFGTGPLDDDQLQNVATALNEVGRRAKDKGLDLAIHNEFWCAVNLSNHEKLLELTDPRYVQYCLDTAQISLMGVDIVDFYDRWHDRMKYMHLKDTNKKNLPDEERFKAGAEYDDEGKRWFYELGAGDVNLTGLYEMFKKHNFKGWATVEADGAPDNLAAMLLSKWYIDNVLSPIYK
ncbi:sugar phosphate isomerase/epimerase [Clostridium sp. SY8519]|uniref:sugar phosphate isomerase/epimerase family protein n=1 Tax=Clostridium sp. (strain SY8519) TaxID=1042156 RepID=UPI0002171B58|nr:sugar phosphate isomerase/epimerase [Clostridium sp. SY8519]BAK47564.1 sugar phosphate isomerase/epimerase [Clostridium sp. SY8519]